MDGESLSLHVGESLPSDLKGGRLLVAVSGGADSVAMLLVLNDLRLHRSMELVAAHLNHGLRGNDADADAEWVSELCRRLSIPIVIETVDTARAARNRGLTIEESARDLRYDFLKRTARSNRCRFVAVAHTSDDQTETVLHHILRGTGLSGLQGMPFRRSLDESNRENSIELIRPLLQVSRADVEAYLRQLGQGYRQDQSNEDDRFTRNRLRNSLLPMLREQFNPQVNEALLRLSRQAADAQETINSVADNVLSRAVRDQSSSVCRLDVQILKSETNAVLRAALVRLWQNLGWPRRKMGFREWSRLAELVRDDDLKAVTLPCGFDARRRGGLLVLRAATSAE